MVGSATREAVVLFLLDARNDYQEALARSARFTCERRGLTLEVQDAANSSDKQLQQILACLRGPARTRTANDAMH